MAQQRAKALVSKVRQDGWAEAITLPTSHGGLTIPDFLERYHRSAIVRGLRPRSISDFEKNLRRVTKDIGARRLAELTPASLQQWVEGCDLKPVTLRTVLRNAAAPFSKSSLQAMGLSEFQNPFARVVRPKVDREPFDAPSRAWIIRLMRDGMKELSGDVGRAFVLALGAGLRWGEIVTLRWEDVRCGRVRIQASKAKGRRSRQVPISKPVQDILKASRSQALVIAGEAEGVHATLCAWLRKRGVKDLKPIHYLRKCYGSLAVADHGVFLGSKLLGHSTIALTASTYAGQIERLPSVKF